MAAFLIYGAKKWEPPPPLKKTNKKKKKKKKGDSRSDMFVQMMSLGWALTCLWQGQIVVPKQTVKFFVFLKIC